jgi:hypothetical protein
MTVQVNDASWPGRAVRRLVGQRRFIGQSGHTLATFAGASSISTAKIQSSH